MADYRQALQALYAAPLASFVAERNRLAAQLRAAGDEQGAKALARRRRPTASAWAVNQLFWHARDAFETLLAAAGRVRSGDLGATRAYREALGELRKRAAAVLGDGSHAASATTLRRVMGSLAAIAATGGFDPDPPGALTADREPPGFDLVGALPSKPDRQPHRAARGQRATGARIVVSDRDRLAAAREREKKRAETKARERKRLVTAIRDARTELGELERTVSLLQKELRATEQTVAQARKKVQGLERDLQMLDESN